MGIIWTYTWIWETSRIDGFQIHKGWESMKPGGSSAESRIFLHVVSHEVMSHETESVTNAANLAPVRRGYAKKLGSHVRFQTIHAVQCRADAGHPTHLRIAYHYANKTMAGYVEEYAALRRAVDDIIERIQTYAAKHGQDSKETHPSNPATFYDLVDAEKSGKLRQLHVTNPLNPLNPATFYDLVDAEKSGKLRRQLHVPAPVPVPMPNAHAPEREFDDIARLFGASLLPHPEGGPKKMTVEEYDAFKARVLKYAKNRLPKMIECDIMKRHGFFPDYDIVYAIKSDLPRKYVTGLYKYETEAEPGKIPDVPDDDTSAFKGHPEHVDFTNSPTAGVQVGNDMAQRLDALDAANLVSVAPAPTVEPEVPEHAPTMAYKRLASLVSNNPVLMETKIDDIKRALDAVRNAPPTVPVVPAPTKESHLGVDDHAKEFDRFVREGNVDTQAKIVAAAVAARVHADPRLTGFRVGAAVMTSTGKIFTGSNAEITSGQILHAETFALGAARNAGHRDIVAMCVASECESCTPCGQCREWIRSVMPPDAPVYVHNQLDTRTTTMFVKDLLTDPPVLNLEPKPAPTPEPAAWSRTPDDFEKRIRELQETEDPKDKAFLDELIEADYSFAKSIRVRVWEWDDTYINTYVPESLLNKMRTNLRWIDDDAFVWGFRQVYATRVRESAPAFAGKAVVAVANNRHLGNPDHYLVKIVVPGDGGAWCLTTVPSYDIY